MLELANLAAKFSVYLGTFLAAGSPLLKLTVSNSIPDNHKRNSRFDTSLTRQTIAGLLMAIIGVMVSYLILQVRMAGGDFNLAFAPDFIGIGLNTSVGQSSVVSLAGALAIAASLSTRITWLGALGALAMVGAFSLQGHTVSISSDAGWPLLGRLILSAVLVFHLLVASWWFAVLVPLQIVPREERDHAAQCFGEWALRAVPAMLFAGATMFGVITNFQLDFNDPYQQRMAVKIAAVMCVLLLAAMNKIWLTGKPGLLWSLRFESLAAAAVLTSTVWLTATGPGMN